MTVARIDLGLRDKVLELLCHAQEFGTNRRVGYHGSQSPALCRVFEDLICYAHAPAYGREAHRQNMQIRLL